MIIHRAYTPMISIVVVNHNTCQHLRACLKTVEQEAPTQTIVVDNASNDGSAEMVRTEFPRVTLYANAKNPGYGAAANQAIENSHGRYILLLNSDTRLSPGTLRSLETYLDENPQAAIVGPRLVNPDGSLQPSCYPFPTPLHIFLEESTLGRLIKAIPIFKEYYLRTWSHNRDRVVPWVLGAALAIRRSAYLSVGGFDESFFIYAEEVDLCYRLHKAGWQTHFTPKATIVHYGGASTKQQRTSMAVQYYTSLLHLQKRNYSRYSLIQTIGIMKSIVFARLLRDKARLRLASDQQQRTQIAADIAAWQQILQFPNK